MSSKSDRDKIDNEYDERDQIDMVDENKADKTYQTREIQAN